METNPHSHWFYSGCLNLNLQLVEYFFWISFALLQDKVYGKKLPYNSHIVLVNLVMGVKKLYAKMEVIDFLDFEQSTANSNM